MTRTWRGYDQAGVWPSIDDELLALVGATIGRHGVRVETDVALDDGASRSGDECRERLADRRKFGVRCGRPPGIGVDHGAVIVRRGLDAAALEIGEAVDDVVGPPIENEDRKAPERDARWF